MKRILLASIRLYQKTLSPDHGWFTSAQPVCRFRPTCSQYAATAIEKYGSMTGMAMALRRIARCHPWQKGGFDPVPPKK